MPASRFFIVIGILVVAHAAPSQALTRGEAVDAGSSLNRVGRGFNHKLNILVSAGSAYFLMHA